MLLSNPWLQVAPPKRTSTTGAVREAARNAKATLLRATAVADPTQAGSETSAVAPGFLDLAVDDRVLVSVKVARALDRPSRCQVNKCGCRGVSAKAPFKRLQQCSKQPYLPCCLARMLPCSATQALARWVHASQTNRCHGFAQASTSPQAFALLVSNKLSKRVLYSRTTWSADTCLLAACLEPSNTASRRRVQDIAEAGQRVPGRNPASTGGGAIKGTRNADCQGCTRLDCT